MKSKLIVIAIAVLGCMFSSCTKQYITDETIIELKPKVILVDVLQKNWGYSNEDNNNYFYASVDLPELTKEAFQKGMFKIYRVWNWGGSNATQMEMPYTRHNEWLNENDNNWYFYTETVDAEFKQGQATVFYTASDFDYEINEQFVPESMTFRIVIYE